jgi:hypothetical protein
VKRNTEKDELVGRLAARLVVEARPAEPADCQDAELVAAYVDRTLDGEELERCERHFAACASCRQMLAELAHGAEVLSGAGAEAGVERARTWSWRWFVPAAATAAVAILWVALRPATFLPRPTPAPAEQMARADELSKAQSRLAPTAAPEPGTPSKGGVQAPAQANAPVAQRARRAEADAGRPEDKRAGKPQVPAARVGAEAPAMPAPTPPAARAEKEMLAENMAKAEAPKEAARTKPVQPSAGIAGAVAADRMAAAPAVLAPQAEPYRAKQAAGVAAQIAPVIVRTPDPMTVWRLGPAGSIERSADGGRTWKRQASGVDAAIVAGSAPMPLVCWAVGQRGTILRTVDGSTWEEVASPTSLDLAAVVARDALTATITAAGGQTWVTTDGARTWQRRE